MANNDVPHFLQGRVLLSLKTSELAKLPNITPLLDSLKRNADKYVLFVDEWHTLMNIVVNGVSLFEFFKALLAEGKVRMIGATTDQEWKPLATKGGDPLTRRFSHIQLQELSIEDTVNILKRSQSKYEEFFAKQFKIKTFTIKDTVIEFLVKYSIVLSPEVRPSGPIRVAEEFFASVCMENQNKDLVEVNATDVDNYVRKKLKKDLDTLLKAHQWTHLFGIDFGWITSSFLSVVSRITSVWNSLTGRCKEVFYSSATKSN